MLENLTHSSLLFVRPNKLILCKPLQASSFCLNPESFSCRNSLGGKPDVPNYSSLQGSVCDQSNTAPGLWPLLKLNIYSRVMV